MAGSSTAIARLALYPDRGVRFLLGRGADRALRTGDGETALDLARDEAKGEAVTLLSS